MHEKVKKQQSRQVNNAHAGTSSSTVQKLYNLDYEILEHLPFS